MIMVEIFVRKGLFTTFANFFVDTSKDKVSMLLGLKAQKDHFKNGIICFIENLSASKIFQNKTRQRSDLSLIKMALAIKAFICIRISFDIYHFLTIRPPVLEPFPL